MGYIKDTNKTIFQNITKEKLEEVNQELAKQKRIIVIEDSVIEEPDLETSTEIIII